jgi:Ran GTPase-activating protein (RanGAP) involved in mRNA processing and transport
MMHKKGLRRFCALFVSGVLTSLDIGWNNLDEQATLSIVRAARQQDKMTSLGLGHCGIGASGANEIAEYMRVSSVLTRLDTRCNRIGGEAAQQLAPAVLGSASLEVFGEVPIKQLRADALTELDLRFEDLGPTEAIVLAKLVAVSSALTTLNLSLNSIGVEGAKAIAGSLRVNSVLTSLDIYENHLGVEGAKSIGQALKVNSVLTTLNLCLNSIGVEGAKAIGGSLRVNSVLTSLSLYGNQIGVEGA